MKKLSDNQIDHIKSAVLQRFLVEKEAYDWFKAAMKNLEKELFDKHFFVQEGREFLNTFIGIGGGFTWADAQEIGWGEVTQWSELNSEFDSYYEEEYRKIKSFLNKNIVGYDLRRFFEEQDIGIDLFIAEVVRQKSIDIFINDVSLDYQNNPIMVGFCWSDAINIGTKWPDLSAIYSSFYESKSEVAAL